MARKKLPRIPVDDARTIGALLRNLRRAAGFRAVADAAEVIIEDLGSVIVDHLQGSIRTVAPDGTPAVSGQASGQGLVVSVIGSRGGVGGVPCFLSGA